MNLIEHSVVELVQKPGFAGLIEQIDLCAGVCYGRESPHTPDKQIEFVEKLINRDHMRCLEFGTIYLTIPKPNFSTPIFRSNYCSTHEDDDWYYITTNYRYILEKKLQSYLKYMCEPTEHHTIRRTFKVVCSRAIADELRTHTTLSGLMKSTRFCDMSEMQVVIPQWLNWYDKKVRDVYIESMQSAQQTYQKLLSCGLSKQQARGVLPLDIATTVLLCGSVGVLNSSWERFIKLRTATAAHEDARVIANEIKEILNNDKLNQNEKEIKTN